MSNIEKLFKTIDMVQGRLAEVTTSEMRVRGASHIESIVPAFGPGWIKFADVSIKRINGSDCPEYTLSAEQFAAYLSAKREFAAE